MRDIHILLLVLLLWRTWSKHCLILFEASQQQVGRHFLVTNLQLLGSSTGPIFSEMSLTMKRRVIWKQIQSGQALHLSLAAPAPLKLLQLSLEVNGHLPHSFQHSFKYFLTQKLLYGQFSSRHWRMKTPNKIGETSAIKICILAGRGQ